jgi:IPT/TIG domain
VSSIVNRQGTRNLKLVSLGVLSCALAGLPAGPAQASVASVQPLSATPSSTQPYAACAPRPAGEASCQAIVTPAGAKLAGISPDSVSAATSGIDGSGLAPSDLQSAYDLPSTTGGSGQTVAVVDAYNDPTAESDLATYRSSYGLPACTTAGGCFDKVSQTGTKSYPPQPDAEQGDWPVEESLDLDMVSAICPNCHIMLVEANSAGDADLGTAEDEAVKLGATEVSNSWASFEFSGETSYDVAFEHPGVPITAASGDWGYDNDEYDAGVPSYPAASPDVIAVGGTDLTSASNSRGWTESVWARSGSGCSVYEPKPSYQTDTGCSKRTTNDIAAAAEDLSIYDTSGTTAEGKLAGWFTVGGTSAATPIIAAYEALSGSETRSLGASAFYKNPSSFFPVTSGSNGSCGGSYLCTGGSGYRGPTGVGTPDGVISGSAPAPSLAVTSVTPDEGPTAGHTTVTIKGSDFVKGATVTIGGKASSVTVHSETELTAVTAAGSAGSDEVVVTDTNGTSTGGPSYTYVAPPKPTVSAISPAEGSTVSATSVTITGSGFVSGATVKIGGKASSVKVLSSTEITAKTPTSAAGSDEVVVTDADGTSSGGPSYTYVAPPVPTVSAISPVEGSTAAGTSVTVTGSGFVSGASVKIGGKATAVTVVSPTEITARTPAHVAGSYEVAVTDLDGTSSAGPSYTYVAPPKPRVDSISPNEGSTSGATAVTITGSGFVAGATVKIGGKATSVTVVSATEITAKTPSSGATSHEAVVTDKNGTSSSGPSYTYYKPSPPATTLVTLACAGSQTCSGTLALVLSGSHASSGGTGVARAAAASDAARRPAIQPIGVAAYAIAPGRNATVKLTLNRRGRALLRKERSGLSVTLSVVGAATSASSEDASAASTSTPTQTKNVRLDLIRGQHGAGRLERSVASPSGGLATVPVGAV